MLIISNLNPIFIIIYIVIASSQFSPRSAMSPVDNAIQSLALTAIATMERVRTARIPFAVPTKDTNK